MDTQSTNGRSVGNAFALVAVCGLATAAVGQRSNIDHPPEESMEWVPGVGVVEEQWYDPTDWFDDDFDGIRGPDVDYDFERLDRDAPDADEDYDDGAYGYTGPGYTPDDWEDSDRSYSAVYGDELYDGRWWGWANFNLNTEAYYDGYFDGYNDDEFGYEKSVAGESDKKKLRSQAAYEKGYYDGFFDQDRGYEADWTYYLYTFPVASGSASSRDAEREADDRERGDRAAAMGTDRMDRREARASAREMDRDRVRGTIERVETLRAKKLPEEYKGHRVVRLTMEDGRKVVADMGEATRMGRLEAGDVVSIEGKRKMMDGREVVDVARVRLNDMVMWNSEKKPQPKKSDG